MSFYFHLCTLACERHAGNYWQEGQRPQDPTSLHSRAEKVEDSRSDEESQQVWKHCRRQGLHGSVGQGALSWLQKTISGQTESKRLRVAELLVVMKWETHAWKTWQIDANSQTVSTQY